MAQTAPTITTQRLCLRAMIASDFDRYAEMWTMPDVVRHIGPPRPRAEAWKRFLQTVGHWQMLGHGQWAITRQNDDIMIGQTGFFQAERGLGADFDTFPEAGWVLVPEAHGQGIGHEAVSAAHDWFDRQRPGVLVAVMTHKNEPSMRLAKRLGYQQMRRAELAGEPVLLLRRE